MAIVTIKASKATPGKALDYITDKGKAAFVSYLHLDPSQDLIPPTKKLDLRMATINGNDENLDLQI